MSIDAEYHEMRRALSNPRPHRVSIIRQRETEKNASGPRIWNWSGVSTTRGEAEAMAREAFERETGFYIEDHPGDEEADGYIVSAVCREDELEDAEIIHSYSRADAIADGNLVDVSETAREAGFTVPVALTRAAWEDCVAWSDDDNHRKGTLQDEAGRLWDVLWMAKSAARAVGDKTTTAEIPLLRTPREGRGHRPRHTRLKMVIGPGDNAEPVITIMMPDED